MEFIKYPKINSIYKRDKKGNQIDGDYSLDIYKYLENNEWIPTEKIDGTNIRIKWDCENKTIEFAGRKENSQIPIDLLNKLESIFTIDLMSSKYPEKSMILFGEGYGNKIQKCGRSYIESDVDFILFGVNISGYWLNIENSNAIAENLNINHVPVFKNITLKEAINIIKEGNTISQISEDENLIIEGFVLRPVCDIYTKDREPILIKIKVKDFK